MVGWIRGSNRTLHLYFSTSITRARARGQPTRRIPPTRTTSIPEGCGGAVDALRGAPYAVLCYYRTDAEYLRYACSKAVDPISTLKHIRMTYVVSAGALGILWEDLL